MNPVAGRVTILDPVTQREVYSITTGVAVDVVPSSDGSLLYITDWDTHAKRGLGGGELFAVDIRTGRERWRVAFENRVLYMFGEGPSIMALSPDGRWLYLYKADLKEMKDPMPYWIGVVDVITGQATPDTVPLPGCGPAILTPSLDGGSLYVTCLGSSDIRFVNLHTRRVEQQLGTLGVSKLAGISGRIKGSVLSRDGRALYVVTDAFQVAVVDVTMRTVSRMVSLGRDYQVVPERSVALSPDGTKLFVGLSTREDVATANEIRTFDTLTWREAGRSHLTKPIGASTLTARADGRSIYSIGAAPLGHADTILGADTDQAPAAKDQASPVMMRKGEDILRVFVGP